jgi:hypothetical protein
MVKFHYVILGSGNEGDSRGAMSSLPLRMEDTGVG